VQEAVAKALDALAERCEDDEFLGAFAVFAATVANMGANVTSEIRPETMAKLGEVGKLIATLIMASVKLDQND